MAQKKEELLACLASYLAKQKGKEPAKLLGELKLLIDNQVVKDYESSTLDFVAGELINLNQDLT